MPTSTQKNPSSIGGGVRHFISAQKSEDGKTKLFADRRTSSNLAGGIQLRVGTQGSLRSGQKSNTKTFLNQDRTRIGSGIINNGLKINSARQDIVSSNLPTSQTASTLGTSNAGSHTVKNTTAYKSKLTSKYGINAQNKLIAEGHLTNQQSNCSHTTLMNSNSKYNSRGSIGAAQGFSKGQYQSNLSNNKNYWRKTTEANATGTVLSNTKKDY